MEHYKEQTWCVYIHTFPNNKKYIGITCRPPIVRWGKTGSGYKDQKLMWDAIQEFGWDNVQHEILFYDLSEEEAKLKEAELISEYKTNLSEYGYNTISKDMKDYNSFILNAKSVKTDIIKRNELDMLMVLYEIKAMHPLTAITLQAIYEYKPTQQSYTTRCRAIRTLYASEYVGVGLKYGKFYSYFITDKGVKILREYSLI